MREIKKRLRTDQRLEIDGGINVNTIGQAREAGVDWFVCGSAVFDKPDRKAAVGELRGAMGVGMKSEVVKRKDVKRNEDVATGGLYYVSRFTFSFSGGPSAPQRITEVPPCPQAPNEGMRLHREGREAAGRDSRGALAALPGVRGHALPQGRRGRDARLPRLPVSTSASRPARGSSNWSTPAASRRCSRTSSRPTRSSSSTRRPTRTASATSSRRPGTRTRSSAARGSSRAGRCMMAVMDPTFMMGSMGSVVGEKITRTIEAAADDQDAAADRQLLRRGADAGVDAVADADGQDVGRPGAAGRRQGPVHLACWPTRPPAASPPASPCSATSSSPSPRP